MKKAVSNMQYAKIQAKSGICKRGADSWFENRNTTSEAICYRVLERNLYDRSEGVIETVHLSVSANFTQDEQEKDN